MQPIVDLVDCRPRRLPITVGAQKCESRSSSPCGRALELRVFLEVLSTQKTDDVLQSMPRGPVFLQEHTSVHAIDCKGVGHA